MADIIAVAQMYTVRQHCQTTADTVKTCAKLKEIGFNYVQTSGIKEPQDAKTLKQIFDDNGLTACTYRGSYEELLNETDRIIEEHKYMGCVAIITGLKPNYFYRDGFYQVAEKLSKVIDKINSAGLILAIHHHFGELERFDGKTGLQIILENCKGLEAELDLYWAQYAGADPTWWIEYCTGRCTLMHFKDMGVIGNQQVMPPIGEGNLNWEKIMTACRNSGVKYAIIEIDKPTIDGFEAFKISLENMKKWGIKTE